MHIIEGMLSPSILAGGGAIAFAANAAALKKMRNEQVMTTALLSSAFFAVSLIHVPVGAISVHLLLNGLLGIILGPACIPAITVGLLLQALIFQHGGITVLGVNILLMAVPALLAHFIFRSWLRGTERRKKIGSFLAGSFANLLTTTLAAIALIGTDDYYLTTAILLVCIHVPVMIIEGVITMYCVSFLAKVQPEILLPAGKIM